MAIPPADRRDIEQAMMVFDRDLRGLPEWSDWKQNGNYEWAIVHEGREYPPKQIIRMSTGATEFSGGPEANGYLRKLGFEIRPLRRDAWDIDPGDRIRRTHLHNRYGGGGQGGIEPSAKTPNVFIFTDPKSGSKYGYNFDGWREGLFHYTGDGQVGDQTFREGNRAIRNHLENGRALRVFDGVKDTVTYMGEFGLAADPFYFAEAPDKNGDSRQVIVFRLRGIDADAPPTAKVKKVAHKVPVEAHNTDRFTVIGTTEQREAERREQPLVLAYRDWMATRGSKIERLQFDLPDGMILFCDLFNEDRNQLIEAKGLGTRQEVRMAIGQLFDYRRWTSPMPDMAVLLLARPERDLEALLDSVGIKCVWRVADDFEDNAGGAFI